MKRVAFLVLISALLVSCDALKSITEPAKKANVVMIEGPIFEDGYTIFYYKGRVQNKGTATASFSKVYVYVRNSAGSLLAQEYTYVDDSDLAPNETSAWDMIFSDSNHSLRNAMDPTKLTYEIKWD